MTCVKLILFLLFFFAYSYFSLFLSYMHFPFLPSIHLFCFFYSILYSVISLVLLTCHSYFLEYVFYLLVYFRLLASPFTSLFPSLFFCSCICLFLLPIPVCFSLWLIKISGNVSLYTVHRGCTNPGHRLALAIIFFTVAPNILVLSSETCFITLFWRLVYYSGFQIF